MQPNDMKETTISNDREPFTFDWPSLAPFSEENDSISMRKFPPIENVMVPCNASNLITFLQVLIQLRVVTNTTTPLQV